MVALAALRLAGLTGNHPGAAKQVMGACHQRHRCEQEAKQLLELGNSHLTARGTVEGSHVKWQIKIALNVKPVGAHWRFSSELFESPVSLRGEGKFGFALFRTEPVTPPPIYKMWRAGRLLYGQTCPIPPVPADWALSRRSIFRRLRWQLRAATHAHYGDQQTNYFEKILHN